MKISNFAKPTLRIAMGLVFLYFGFQQFTSTANWIGFVPDFALSFGLTAKNIVLVNGIMELILGTLLLFGLYTKFASLILSLHLFVIAFSLGFNDLGMRDFGLAVATLVVFMNGTDKLCLDEKFKNKHNM